MDKKRTFNLLLLAQSLSAFGDNAYYAVVMGLLLASVRNGAMTVGEFGVLSALYANCMFLPYVVLSPFVGWLSDRFEKRSVLIGANLLKGIGALLGIAAAATPGTGMMAAYLTVGVGAAVYSPSKYGIIPELRSQEELVKANASMEMTTILSILLGTVGGSIMIDRLGGSVSFFVLTCIFAVSALFNMMMERTGIFNADEKLRDSLKDFASAARLALTDRLLFIAVIGTGLFWGAASFVKLNLQTWGQSVMGLGTATQISMLALWLSIGIIVGSFAAGKLFKTGNIRQAWSYGGAMGMVITMMALWYGGYAVTLGELILLGALGGMFLVPLNAEVQARSTSRAIGKVIAIQNVFDNGAMLASAGVFWAMNRAGASPTLTFISLGIFLMVFCLCWLRPALRRAAGSSS